MPSNIVIDMSPSGVTTANPPAFPWFRFDAGQFICEEALINGDYVGLHFSAMGRPNCRERLWDLYSRPANVYIPRTQFHAFDIEVDGQRLHHHWALESNAVSKTPAGYDECRIVLRDERWPIRVTVHTLLDGSSFLVRWLEIENTGDAPMALSRVFPWCGRLFTPTDLTTRAPESYAFSLGRYRNLWGCKEGEFHWLQLPDGTYKEELTKLCKFAPCFYLVRSEDTGEVAVVDFAYSGGTCAEFTRVGKPRECSGLHARVGLAGNAPMRVLGPHESLETPRVHLSMLYGDADTCANALFTHLRRSVLPAPPQPVSHPVGYHHGGYTNPYWLPLNRDIIRREIDMAARLGAETFTVDAGWNVPPGMTYPQVFGDWRESALMENGLGDCFDYAREKGLGCGLWVPIEIVGKSADVYARHPEWCLTDSGRQVLMLDLTRPEVEEYVFDTIAGLVSKYRLDIFRIDGGAEYICTWDRPAGKYVEDAAWRYYDALYRIFERINRQFPNLMLENCWGGGGRIDLGIMRRFHRVQYSDNWHPEEQLRSLNGLTLSLPPEQCLSFIGAINMNPVDTDFCVRAGLFGQFDIAGVAPGVDKINEDAVERWRHSIELYKRDIRPWLGTCQVYHHTLLQDYSAAGDWLALEYGAEDRSAGMAGIFRLGQSAGDVFRIVPRGLDVSRDYAVWLDNARRSAVIPGARLCTEGLPVRIAGPMMSELLIFKAV